MRRILDAKYKKSDLNKVMTNQCQHLNIKELNIFLSILSKFEDLSEGTLGMCNTNPIDLELRYDKNSVCSRPYPVPRVLKAMFRKEVKRLVILGVLEEANDS